MTEPSPEQEWEAEQCPTSELDHILIAGTCEYASLCDKRTLQTLRILRWGNYHMDYQWRTNVIIRMPYKREPWGSESVVGEMMSEVRKGQESRRQEACRS